MNSANTLQSRVVDRGGLPFPNDFKPLWLATPPKMPTVACGVPRPMANLLGLKMTDRPYVVIPLRQRIEMRRAIERGQQPQSHTLSAEQWDRKQAARKVVPFIPYDPNREREAQSVYFIQAGCGSIKIGIAANVKARLASLQTANPSKLTLLATCDGGAAREQAYHEAFADHREAGEWFAPHPDILAEIARLSEGNV